MNDPIHHLQVLHNNPFIFAPPLAAFFEELGEKKNALLLGYLVLPMSLYLPSRTFLRNSNRRSSLRSMLRDRTRIYGLEARIQRYRAMTNVTLQHLLGAGCIAFDSRLLSVSVIDRRAIHEPSPEGAVKAAGQLGYLFRPYEVTMVYRMLGVMQL